MITIFSLDEWRQIVERGTNGDQVMDILESWETDARRQQKEIYLLRGMLEDALVDLYNMDDCRAPYAVAKLCDEKLDRSGALLGRVRQRARILKGGVP